MYPHFGTANPNMESEIMKKMISYLFDQASSVCFSQLREEKISNCEDCAWFSLVYSLKKGRCIA